MSPTAEQIIQAARNTAQAPRNSAPAVRQAIANDHRAAIIRREAGKAGLRGRINAKCCECIYDPHAAGTWRKQAENCASRGCPLYAVRPLAGGGE